MGMDIDSYQQILRVGNWLLIAGVIGLVVVVATRVHGQARGLAVGGMALIALSRIAFAVIAETSHGGGLGFFVITNIVFGNILPFLGLAMLAAALVVATRRSLIPDVSGLAAEPGYQGYPDPAAPPQGTQEL